MKHIYPFITKFTSLFGTTISLTNSLFPNHLAAAIFASDKISSFEVSGPMEDVATYTIEITGTGALTFA